MPSERCKRQQRVRHEVGDFVAAAALDRNSSAQPSREESKEVNKNGHYEDKEARENKNEGDKPDSINAEEERNFEKEKRNVGGNFRRSDERKYNNRNNEKYRGHGGNRGRGRGVIQGREHTADRSFNKTCDTNVAVAEEKTYESVTIMKSASDIAKESSDQLKYRRREVISNWLHYNELPTDDDVPVEGEDYLMGEDFSEVLKLSGCTSAGGFLHLKGELSWGDIDSSQSGTHGLGALKVADLVSSLATMPLHTQLRIPEEALPAYLVSTYNSDAEARRKVYKPNQEFVTDIDVNEKILESLKFNEAERFQLPSEEVRQTEKINAIDATLKFSSAFVPEDDDVDLDKLISDPTNDSVLDSKDIVGEDVSSQPLVCESQKVNETEKITPKIQDEKSINKKTAPSIQDLDLKSTEEKKDKDNKFSIPKLSTLVTQDKMTFNFGLPSKNIPPVSTKIKKLNNAKDFEVPEVIKKSEEQVGETVTEPLINLDAPTQPKKEPVILVSKTEAENLEDWLDSILDD